MEEKVHSAVCRLTGTVIHGRGIGKLVGMPTADLQVSRNDALPDAGAYIAAVRVDGETYYGVTHIGPSPTIDSGTEPSVETHLFRWRGDLYGRVLEVELYERLRGPQKFEHLSALLQQIRRDCLIAREYWGIREESPGLVMDLKKHQTKIGEWEIPLSAKEFDVLYLLYSEPETLFTKEQIYERVWHEPANHFCHAVENTVFQIRKKLKRYAPDLVFIKTVVGYGYRFGPEKGRQTPELQQNARLS